MQQEVREHEAKMFQIVTERMNVVGELLKRVQEARLLAVQVDAAAERLAVYDHAVDQLDRVRQAIDAKARDVKASTAKVHRQVEWLQPLENGFGYPTQFPKRTWDAFLAVLDYLPVDERQAIRQISLSEEEFRPSNFTPELPPETWYHLTEKVDLAHLLGIVMLPRAIYPKQGSPLHSRFKDDVLPKIRGAVRSAEESLAKSLDAIIAEQTKAAKDLLAAAETK